MDSSLFPFTPALDMLEFISRPLSFSPISSIRILQTKLTFDVKYFEIWIYFHVAMGLFFAVHRQIFWRT